jgi:hypothetical protein
MSSRSGHASSASLRPARACERAGTSRGRAPRCSYETTPATPHRKTPARCPHPQARWLLWPAGRFHTPTLRLETLRLAKWRVLRARPSWFPGVLLALLGGWSRSAWRVGRPCLRRPRGPQRADPGWGVGDAVVCGHRGANSGTQSWVPRGRNERAGTCSRRAWGLGGLERRVAGWSGAGPPQRMVRREASGGEHAPSGAPPARQNRAVTQ